MIGPTPESFLETLEEYKCIIKSLNSRLAEAEAVIELSLCRDKYIRSFNCKVSALKQIRSKARQYLEKYKG